MCWSPLPSATTRKKLLEVEHSDDMADERNVHQDVPECIGDLDLASLGLNICPRLLLFRDHLADHTQYFHFKIIQW